MNEIAIQEQTLPMAETPVMNDYLVFSLAGQKYCINVGLIRDVLRSQKLTPVPLVQESVTGVMNLRGYIVTAVDARRALGLEPRESGNSMSIVVERGDYLYSLVVDKVSEVIRFESKELDSNPSILEGELREVSQGVIKHHDELVICVDIEKFFDMLKAEKEAG